MSLVPLIYVYKKGLSVVVQWVKLFGGDQKVMCPSNPYILPSALACSKAVHMV